MKQSIWTSSHLNVKTPQAFIAKGKQRLKQFSGNVYLSDGDEYQIELFNPTPQHVLAKIKIDNEYISSNGIVLRPGERVFLERFLDSNNKFVFKTYSVSANDVEVLSAIRNNGYIGIEFYNEDKSIPSGPVIRNPYYLTGTSSTSNWNTTFVNYNLPMGGTFTTTGIANFSYTNNSNNNQINTINTSLRKMETGVTEKGNASSQTFTNSNRKFLDFYSSFVGWQILPTSNKPHTSEDVNILYCGECGAKRKKDTFKFCPHCGTKY